MQSIVEVIVNKSTKEKKNRELIRVFLEQTLHKRDYELQKLQNEIDKGTSSIMSSIEDLYTASSNVSSPKSILKHHPFVEQNQVLFDDNHFEV
ncbi:unnamed protein product [Rotaria sp. Silwood2]|nr:unnamed protein product [Rotaria sp. Silwood2]